MSNRLSNIYNNLPVFLQNTAISLYGYQWYKRRFGGVFLDEYKKFKDRENFTFQQWQNYQTEGLRKILTHSFRNVPYYNILFKSLRLEEADLEKFELKDLNKISYLEKDELRRSGTSTILAINRNKKGDFFASSGSTGTPVSIFYSHEMHQTYNAMVEARCRNWAGVSRFDVRGMIGGRRVVPKANAKDTFYRYSFVEKLVYFSAYHISAETAKDYLKGIQKYHVQYMNGYAMSNYFLARFFDELNYSVPELKAVITSSEKLTPEMRNLFKKVYNCKTYDSYSGVEACGAITECEKGKLHINPDIGILEVLDENGNPCAPGVRGELVCTGLINFDQPLIRYRIGDSISLSDKKCECGREMPVVEEIFGRIEDVVVGPDGREMVRFHGLFVGIPKIIESQVVQHTLNDFTINVVCQEKLLPEEENLIKKRLYSQLGNVNVKIIQKDRIPRGANGKFKAVISEINKKA